MPSNFSTQNKQKLIFAGTPEFAAEHLKGLIAAGHEIALVLTQPDARVGRGRKTKPTPVKAVAIEHDIPVLQPESLKNNDEVLDQIKSINPEFMIVVAYGLLIPMAFLDAPVQGCLNVHGSILPRWRGAAPVQRAIESMDAESGVCVMQMDVGLDTGPVRHQINLPIERQTSAELLDQLAVIGVDSLLEVLEAPASFPPVAQPEEGVTYAHKIHKSEKTINWTLSAKALDAKVRALQPWPSVMVENESYAFKILEAQPAANGASSEPGTIIAVDAKGIEVAAGDGSERLLIQKIQVSGGKPVNVKDFLHGKPDYFQKGQSLKPSAGENE